MHGERAFEVGRSLLLWVLGLMVLFGLSLVFFDNRGIPGPLHALMNQSIWAQDELPADVVLYHRFVHAVLGATIASWALALFFVARNALAREAWAWWCVLLSTLIWFVPDTTASLYFGVYPNAVFNVVCLAAFALPLLLTRPR